jgi:ADP-ribose pyrophosphatase
MSQAHGKKLIGEGRFLRLVDRDGWEYVERKGSTGIAVLVATTPQDKLLFVEQHRAALARRVVELPAGLAGDTEDVGEDLAAAAQRELIEETGYEAGRLVRLAEGPPSSGATSESVTFFRATGLRRVGPGGGDHSEDIEVHEVAPHEVLGWLEGRRRDGALVDPKVYAGLFFAGVVWTGETAPAPDP